MGLSELLDRIKEALGIGGSRGQSERRPPQSGGETATEPTSEGTTVTVEREPSTESEDAVKGTDTAAEAPSTPSTEAEDVEDEATSASDVEPKEADTDEEPSEAETDEEAVESTEDEAPGETGGDEDLGTDEPTDVIKGIGSTYADRLANAGVETVADLATRDAEALSEETGISDKRLQTWIERAKHR